MAIDILGDLLVRIAASLSEDDLQDPETEALLRQALEEADPEPGDMPPELIERLAAIENKEQRFHEAAYDMGVPGTPEALAELARMMVKAGLLGATMAKSLLAKAPPLSGEEADEADSWKEAALHEHRDRFHDLITRPHHDADRAAQRVAMEKEGVPTKTIGGVKHFLLHRGGTIAEHGQASEGRLHSPTVTVHDPNSFSTKHRIAQSFSNSYGVSSDRYHGKTSVHSAWVPHTHLAYAFHHHRAAGTESHGFGSEREVLVSPGEFPRATKAEVKAHVNSKLNDVGTKEHKLAYGPHSQFKKSDLLAKSPVVSDAYTTGAPYSGDSPGKHVKTIKSKEGHVVKVYHKIGDKTRHITPSEVTTYRIEHPENGWPISQLEVMHHDPDSGEEKPNVSYSHTEKAFRGKGFGSALYRVALKQHGTLHSDERLTPGSQKMWEKLAQDPRNKVKMGEGGNIETRHVASRIQKVKGIQGEMFDKNESLEKAPYEQAQPQFNEHIAFGLRRGEKHLKTNAMPDGTYHHHFVDRAYHRHILSGNKDPKAEGFAELSGTLTKDHNKNKYLKVNHSSVTQSNQGYGFGKQLYSQAAKAHGELRSDKIVSPEARRTYESFRKDPKFHVKIGRIVPHKELPFKEAEDQGEDFGTRHRLKYLGKSELLAKEQNARWEENTFHGWISPQGEYHHLKRDEAHHRDGPNPQISMDQRHAAGWISVAHAGHNNAMGEKATLENSRHPATAKLRELSGKHWSGQTMDIGYASGHNEDGTTGHVGLSADHFSRHGLKGAVNAQRLGKSEELFKSLKATGNDIQEGFDVLHNYENPDEDSSYARKLVSHYNKHATKPSKRVPIGEVKNYIGADWGRKVSKKHLNNPIIVANVNGIRHILDGSHRALEHVRRGSKHVNVVEVPMHHAQGIQDAEEVGPIGHLAAVKKSENLEKAPRSPRKGHTLKQLKDLSENNWHNPDTGTEINPEEGEEYLHRLSQNKAARNVKAWTRPLGNKKKPGSSSDEGGFFGDFGKTTTIPNDRAHQNVWAQGHDQKNEEQMVRPDTHAQPPVAREAARMVADVVVSIRKSGDPAKHVFWHGSPSGNLKGGSNGLHLGTHEAAKQALEARIGVPAEGTWDGTREYGKTLLAGQNKLRARGISCSGYNMTAPKEDHYAPPENHPNAAKYGDKSPVKHSHKPEIAAYHLKGPMTNTPTTPHEDAKANGLMSAQIKRGTAKRGYYYHNIGEDAGSTSIVVPHESHVEKLKKSDTDEDANTLMNRQEDKYLLPRKQLEAVHAELSSKLKQGDIDTSVRYNLNRTIYLDNQDMDSFRHALEHAKPRLKARIRSYSPNGKDFEDVAYVELKIKQEDGTSKKHRVRVTQAVATQVAEGAEIVLDKALEDINKDIPKDKLASRVTVMNSLIAKYGFRRHLEVRYWRRAYSDNKLRITIDDGLEYHAYRYVEEPCMAAIKASEEWEDLNHEAKKLQSGEFLIMEVKYQDEPESWVKDLLDRSGAKELSLSKYCAAVATQIHTGKDEGKIIPTPIPQSVMAKSSDYLRHRRAVELKIRSGDKSPTQALDAALGTIAAQMPHKFKESEEPAKCKVCGGAKPEAGLCRGSLAKSDDLEKMGVMRRIAPFNPQKDVSPSEVKQVDAWGRHGGLEAGHHETIASSIKQRNALPQMHPAAKLRAVHKLHGMTPSRMNAKTGKREFLMHRGMNVEESESKVRGKHYHADDNSSWTPKRHVAEDFASGGGDGGPTHSAWIPEDKVVHTPRMLLNPKGKKQEFENEHEFIVAPGKYEIAHHEEPKNSNLNQRINNRHKATIALPVGSTLKDPLK